MATRTGRQGARRTAPRARRAGGAGKRAADSPVIKFLGRAGFFARGVEYVVIGWIAVEIAFGHSGTQADKSGALQALGKNAAGQVALWLLAIGFIGMALWRLSEAIWGQPGPDGRKATKRLASLGRTVLYAFFAYGVLKYAIGLGAPASTNTQARDLTAKVLHYPGGQIAVAIAGLVIIGAGLALAYGAFQGKFLRQLQMAGTSPRTRKVVEKLGQVGGVARGVVFAVVGVFLVIAALTKQADRAKGLDSSLRAFASTPLGPWLLIVMAAGLIIFGTYSWCEAKWRQT